MSITATIERPAPEALSVPQAARRQRVDVKTLRKAIAAGDVRVIRLASALRVPSAEMARLLAAKT